MPITPSTGGGVRTRSRTPQGSGPAAGGRAGVGGGGWMTSGASARAKAEEELARQREAQERRASGLYMPFRFWVGVGEQREIVVLDAQLGPCFYEHQLQNPRTGKWDTYETCPKEWEPCPLCDSQKESYYVMMLTVMDLTPYTNKQGVTVPHSRKLLPVKAQQQPFFMRQFDRHQTLRGLQLLMSRDTKQTAGIGTPEFVALHAENDIIESFGHDPVLAQDGKVLKERNSDCFPFPYDRLFTKPSAEDLRARYGGMAPAGSRQEYQQEWSGAGAAAAGGSTDDMDDEIPF
jgi:hypothetical protein